MSENRNKIISSYADFYEGFEEKSLTPDQIFTDQSSGLWQPETNTFLDFYTLKSLFFTEDWVYILVDRIASKISSQYLRVMRDDVVNGKKVSKPAEGHPAQKILDAPNEVQDYHTWMYGLVADDCLLGNSFNWFSKSLGQIIPIPGENCRPFFNGKGDLEKYVITQSTSEGQKPMSWSLSIDEICHIRRPNPSSLYIGLSPFIAAQKSLLFSRYSAEYLNNFYIKGAQPGIVLEMAQEANQEMALRLLRSMESAYTGRRNQRRNMVLPRGVKATQMNVSLADQQLIDLVNQNREKIINILQVPKHELSLAESGSLGSEEYRIAIRNFWRGTLRSTMRRIAGALSLKMKDMLGEGYYLEFDLSDIEYLSDDESIKADTATKMLSVHTVNEVRAKVYDLPPLPNGDTTPGAQPGFGLLPSLPAVDGGEIAPEAETNQVTTPTQSLNGAQVASLMEIVAAFNRGELTRESALNLIRVSFALSEEDASSILGPKLDLPEIAPTEMALPDNTKAIERADSFLKSNGGKWWEDRQRIEREAVDPAQEKMVVGIAAILKAQALKAAAAFKTSQKSYSTKADDKISQRELRKRIAAALDGLEDDYLNLYADALKAVVEAGYNTALTLPFGLPNQDALNALRDRNADRRYSILKGRSIDSFAYVSKSTTDDIMATIVRGTANSDSINDIAKAIVETVAGTGEELSLGRAARIARTETLTASSIGQAAAMRDAEKATGEKFKKMWITANDDRVRDLHAESHGEVVEGDEKFSTGLSYPREPGGQPGNVINCRCSWVMVPESEAGRLDDWSDEIKTDGEV